MLFGVIPMPILNLGLKLEPVEQSKTYCFAGSGIGIIAPFEAPASTNSLHNSNLENPNIGVQEHRA